jgi:hypothetical protein
MSVAPNKEHSVDAPIARVFHIVQALCTGRPDGGLFASQRALAGRQ